MYCIYGVKYTVLWHEFLFCFVIIHPPILPSQLVIQQSSYEFTYDVAVLNLSLQPATCRYNNMFTLEI